MQLEEVKSTFAPGFALKETTTGIGSSTTNLYDVFHPENISLTGTGSTVLNVFHSEFQKKSTLQGRVVTLADNIFTGNTNLISTGVNLSWSSSDNYYLDSLFIDNNGTGGSSMIFSKDSADTMQNFVEVINNTNTHIYLSYAFDQDYKDVEIENASGGFIHFGRQLKEVSQHLHLVLH